METGGGAPGAVGSRGTGGGATGAVVSKGDGRRGSRGRGEQGRREEGLQGPWGPGGSRGDLSYSRSGGVGTGGGAAQSVWGSGLGRGSPSGKA